MPGCCSCVSSAGDPAVSGGDDLLGVDALGVAGGRAEVCVAELALDDVQRHAFASELDGVCVAQLAMRERSTGPRALPG